MPAPSGVSTRVVVVSNRLPQVTAAMQAAVAAEIERGARAIEAAAKQKAPVRTGTLRRSIHTVLSNGGMTATVGPSVRYGPYVEFGTRHMAARPYLRPAAELEMPRLVDAVKRVLGRV